MSTNSFVHPTSDVSPSAQIGAGTKIWQHCLVREDAVIGSNCVLNPGVYIDAGVHIGSNVNIQNGISLYRGVTLEDGVFCGPHCTFTNDKLPRAINPDGSLKGASDWQMSETLVKMGASIGAHATILCGVTIGRWAMIGAGAVVTHDVPDYGLVYGNPARLHGFACACGGNLEPSEDDVSESDQVHLTCLKCGRKVTVPLDDYARID